MPTPFIQFLNNPITKMLAQHGLSYAWDKYNHRLKKHRSFRMAYNNYNRYNRPFRQAYRSYGRYGRPFRRAYRPYGNRFSSAYRRYNTRRTYRRW